MAGGEWSFNGLCRNKRKRNKLKVKSLNKAWPLLNGACVNETTNGGREKVRGQVATSLRRAGPSVETVTGEGWNEYGTG